MIQIQRGEVIRMLRLQPVKNYNGHNHLVMDARRGKGDQAMAFLVKKGEIKFSDEQLKEELNLMVESSLITIEQWENMLNLLEHASNGKERVTNFLRRKRRIVVR